MTKNKKRFGIVAIMLVLILAIGATAGTTLARYISSASIDTQTATVAKWGYTLTGSTEGLFSAAYNNGEKKTWTSAVATDASIDVLGSSANDTLVAPGTGAKATLFSIQGSSQVAAEFKIDVTSFATVLLTNGSGDGKVNYRPIVWKVNGVTMTVTNASDFAKLIAKGIKAKVADATVGVKDAVVYVQLPANTSLLNNKLEIVVEWEWVLGDESADTQNNIYDTLLGRIAQAEGKVDSITDLADYSGSVYKINLGLTATILQVQDWTTGTTAVSAGD